MTKNLTRFIEIALGQYYKIHISLKSFPIVTPDQYLSSFTS